MSAVLAQSNMVVASLLNTYTSLQSLRFLASVIRFGVEVRQGDWVLLAHSLQSPSTVGQVVQLVEISLSGSMSSSILLSCSSCRKLKTASDGTYWSSRESAAGESSEMIVPYESTHLTVVMRNDCISHFTYV